MDITPEDIKNIQKGMKPIVNDLTSQHKIETPQTGRIGGTMLLMTFGLLGMTLLLVIESMFYSMEQLQVNLVFILSILMVLCGISFFILEYYAVSLKMEIIGEDELSRTLKDLDQQTIGVIHERVNNQSIAIQRINLFLREQYGDGFE
jgi:hypothetical protein